MFFTADTHFADARVLRIDRRPFADLAAHDEALVAAWNARVGPGDTVFHLGDFAKGSPAAKAAILARLNGVKHLVAGNNDDAETLSLEDWASVSTYRELSLDGRGLVLCHYAFRTWNGMGKGAIDLHGHSHGRLKPIPRQFDVGVDAFPFAPITLAEILASRPGRRAGATRDPATPAPLHGPGERTI